MSRYNIWLHTRLWDAEIEPARSRTAARELAGGERADRRRRIGGAAPRTRRPCLGLPPVPARLPTARLGRALPRPPRSRRWSAAAGAAAADHPSGRRWLDEVMGQQWPRTVATRCLLDGRQATRSASPRPTCSSASPGPCSLLDVMGFLGDEELLGRGAASRLPRHRSRLRRRCGSELGLARLVRAATTPTSRSGCGSARRALGADLRRRLDHRLPSRWSSTSGRPTPPAAALTRASPAGAGPSSRSSTEGRALRPARPRDAPLRRAARAGATSAFELALDIDPADAADVELLARRLAARRSPDASPATVDGLPRLRPGLARRRSGSPRSMYVRSREGWFSDRSICYLASGKPVLAQDTGLRAGARDRRGTARLRDADEAAAAVEEIERRLRRARDGRAGPGRGALRLRRVLDGPARGGRR